MKCAIQMMIRMTVFWTVCMPNHIAMRNLKCAIQMMVWTIVWNAHFKLRIAMWFGIHTVQNTVFWILIQNAHFELKFKIRTLPSCENSHNFYRAILTKIHYIKMSHLWVQISYSTPYGAHQQKKKLLVSKGGGGGGYSEIKKSALSTTTTTKIINYPQLIDLLNATHKKKSKIT